jgi:polyhydroxyalkanoate synthesis repressor PhaR
MSKQERIIKKYPNRRLYDTQVSSYITLDDIKKLVLNSVNFKVVDARSEEDLTNATLLQIITEQEEQGTPMFTNQILQQLIRFYGNSMQGAMSNYLEQSMDLFMKQQEAMQKQFGQTLTSNPIQAMNEITKHNIDLYKTWQESMMHFFKQPEKKD